MPTYTFCCSKCKLSRDVLMKISELESPSSETLIEITCPKHGIMKREVTAPMLNGTSGLSEKQLLQKKQNLVKKRAQLHTKNEGWKDIKDPGQRKAIYDKYHKGKGKGLTGDHEKIKY